MTATSYQPLIWMGCSTLIGGGGGFFYPQIGPADISVFLRGVELKVEELLPLAGGFGLRHVP